MDESRLSCSVGGADSDFSLMTAFNTLLFDGCINSTEYMELQSRSFFFEPASRKNNKPAHNKAIEDGIEFGGPVLRSHSVDGGAVANFADALTDAANRIIDTSVRNVDQDDVCPAAYNPPVFGDPVGFVGFVEEQEPFIDSVSRKRPRIDDDQVLDTVRDTPSWTLNPIVRDAIEEHCDHVSSICFGKIAQCVGNSLHFHDEWNPGRDDHFAIWSDCHSVSFIHKNEKTQCKL